MIDNGRNIRFATNVAELEHDHFGGLYEPWRQHPRVVYLQNASDPVVWWSADLLWREPDWMREQTSNQSGATMTWMPWVTFWQITLDMPDALTPQAGQGHQYQSELIGLERRARPTGLGRRTGGDRAGDQRASWCPAEAGSFLVPR